MLLFKDQIKTAQIREYILPKIDFVKKVENKSISEIFCSILKFN